MTLLDEIQRAFLRGEEPGPLSSQFRQQGHAMGNWQASPDAGRGGGLMERVAPQRGGGGGLFNALGSIGDIISRGYGGRGSGIDWGAQGELRRQAQADDEKRHRFYTYANKVGKPELLDLYDIDQGKALSMVMTSQEADRDETLKKERAAKLMQFPGMGGDPQFRALIEAGYTDEALKYAQAKQAADAEAEQQQKLAEAMGYTGQPQPQPQQVAPQTGGEPPVFQSPYDMTPEQQAKYDRLRAGGFWKQAEDARNDFIERNKYEFEQKQKARPPTAEELKQYPGAIYIGKDGEPHFGPQNLEVVTNPDGTTTVRQGTGSGNANASVPAEVGGRLGLGEKFLTTDYDTAKKLIEGGGVTGPIDALEGVFGRGDAGKVYRLASSGLDALRRGLTGAGMSESEAADYTRRYMPSATDTQEIALEKLTNLKADLESVRKGTILGKIGKLGVEITPQEKEPAKQETEYKEGTTANNVPPGPSGISPISLKTKTPSAPEEPPLSHDEEVLKEYENASWLSRFGTDANDAARIAADATSSGFLDKVLGGDEAQKTADAWTRQGYNAYIPAVAGALASPIMRGVGAAGRGIASGVKAATPAVEGLIGKVLGGAGKMALASGEGAALGGLAGAGEAPPGEELQGAGAGALAGAIVGPAVQGAGKIIGQAGKGVASTAGRIFNDTDSALLKELDIGIEAKKASSQALYKAAQSAGVKIEPNTYRSEMGAVKQTLMDAGYSPRAHPATKAVLDEIGDLTKGGKVPTLERMIGIRHMASDVASSSDPAQSRMGGILKGEIDNYIDNLGPAKLIAGNAEAAKGLQQAAKEWAQYRTAETIRDLLNRATKREGANYSRAGLGTAFRQELKQYSNTKAFKRLPDDLRKEIESAVKGTGWDALLKVTSKLSPTSTIPGFGLLGSIVSAPLFGPTVPLVGGGLALGGAASRAAYDALNLNHAEDLVSMALGKGKKIRPPAPQGTLGKIAGRLAATEAGGGGGGGGF